MFGDPHDPRNDLTECGLGWITITALEDQDDQGQQFLGVYWDPFSGGFEVVLGGC